MKKQYITPCAEITHFEVEDIITSSGMTDGGDHTAIDSTYDDAVYN